MVAGRAVFRVVDALIPGTFPRYAHAVEDVVRLVEAEGPVLSAIFAALS